MGRTPLDHLALNFRGTRRLPPLPDQFTPGENTGMGRTSASLIGRLRSSAFRLSTTTVSMSPTGSCFSSESAPRPFHHGIRGRGGAIYTNRRLLPVSGSPSPPAEKATASKYQAGQVSTDNGGWNAGGASAQSPIRRRRNFFLDSCG